MNISEQLKILRKKNDYTIKYCAEHLGVSQSTYRDWEYGRAISGEPYTKIANFFGISLSTLFGLSTSDLNQKLNELEKDLAKSINSIKSIRSLL